MAWCDRGVQTLLTSLGAFASISLMSVAIGTDYWLYSRAHNCNTTSNATADEAQTPLQSKKTRGDLTHSGLWKICCMEGINNGSCYWINHFSVEDYDTENSEYILRLVRASSIFPILSTVLLLIGGLCVGIGHIYSSRNNIILSAGILFVSAGLSNIIGIVVYISSNAGDPGDKKGEDKKNLYSYGWSFYSGVLSFILAETIAVLAVNIYIEKNKEIYFKHLEFNKNASSRSSSLYTSIPSATSFYQKQSQSCSQSTHPSKDTFPATLGINSSLPLVDISLYTLGIDHPLTAAALASYNTDLEHPNFLHVHKRIPKDVKDSLNHRITPV